MDEKKAPTKKQKLRKTILTLAFIALNVAVIVATAVNEFGDAETAAELATVQLNGWLLIPAALCFAGMIGLEFYKYALMLHKLTPTKLNWREEWRLGRRAVLLGRYYDRITPAAVGGQPFQIYYLHKNGKIPTGIAAAAPITSMISGQVAFILLAVPCFLFSGIMRTMPALAGLAWAGLLFYGFWPVMVAGAVLAPKQTTSVIKWLVKGLAKIRIVKDREKALYHVEHEIGEYVKVMKKILKQRGLLLSVILLSIVSNALMAFIPYFVLEAFGGDMDFMACFALSNAVMSAVYFVPTPGNAGAAEGTFYVVFSALSAGYVFWAMLVWRFFSYYIYIIMGPLVYAKMKWEKRKA